MVLNEICGYKLIARKKPWICVNVAIYAVVWAIDIIMAVLSIPSLIEYQIRSVYHIEFSSINNTDGEYAVIKDNYNISSCPDMALVNYRPIPDLSSTIIGHNIHSRSLVALYIIAMIFSLIRNFLIDFGTFIYYLCNGRKNEKKNIRLRDKFTAGLFSACFKDVIQYQYNISLYTFDSSFL